MTHFPEDDDIFGLDPGEQPISGTIDGAFLDSLHGTDKTAVPAAEPFTELSTAAAIRDRIKQGMADKTNNSIESELTGDAYDGTPSREIVTTPEAAVLKRTLLDILQAQLAWQQGSDTITSAAKVITNSLDANRGVLAPQDVNELVVSANALKEAELLQHEDERKAARRVSGAMLDASATLKLTHDILMAASQRGETIDPAYLATRLSEINDSLVTASSAHSDQSKDTFKRENSIRKDTAAASHNRLIPLEYEVVKPF